MRTRRRVARDFAKLTRHTAEQLDALVDLADVYGDAVTLIKGFRGDLTKFIVSVSSTMLESDAFRSAPAPVQSRFLVGLLLRLYLAHEFWQRCAFVRSKLQREAMSIDRAELDGWIPDRTIFIEPSVRRIVLILERELLVKERYKDTVITAGVAQAAVDAVGRGINVVHRQYLTELAWEIGALPIESVSVATHEALELIMKGDIPILDSSVDINDLFMLMQQRIISSVRNVPYNEESSVPVHSFLQPIAALLRCSLLAFYQRDGDDLEPARRDNPDELVRRLRQNARMRPDAQSFDEEDV
jgi:hypothetical protein